MSLRVMVAVWDGPQNIAGTDLLVLLALADHADDRGGSCYPKITRLAERCRVSDRTVQRSLRTLEQAGYIRRLSDEYLPPALQQRDRRYRPNAYEIIVAHLTQGRHDDAPDSSPPPGDSRGRQPVTAESGRGDAADTSGATHPSPRGDTVDAPGATPASPRTPTGTVREPPTNVADATASDVCDPHAEPLARRFAALAAQLGHDVPQEDTPQWRRWVAAMHRLLRYGPEEAPTQPQPAERIEFVLDWWAHDVRDGDKGEFPGWAIVVRCPQKLRVKWTQMLAQARADATRPTRSHTRQPYEDFRGANERRL